MQRAIVEAFTFNLLLVGANSNCNRSWHLSHKLKPKKSVRMNIPAPVVHPPQTVSSTAVVEPGGRPANNAVEIKDLCSHLKALSPDLDYSGYLADDEQRFHELVRAQQSIQTHPMSTISLETLLKHNEGGFSRQQRHKIASVVASSMLQLQTTPWLPQKFGKQDILFYKQDSTIHFDYPFIRHSFTSSKSLQSESIHSASPTARFLARDSLSNLGIMLLEICYGQSIEDQPIRTKYLTDGLPHEFTNFMTARDWAENVFEQEPEWEHIIRCCISCMFEEKPDWANKRFTAAVYESVVEPLEKMVLRWSLA